ncbi:DUF998 domain-containing protein [Skermania piniformis]|uniref:DUF998 domain-containing protein n=1 Tax=Skermania pinensis TaxID=39122 RepID=A0ABX8SEL7_9ACTN|nr:DUF998 domain-containing protein [Skermania piniformis]QXQ15597.1 DUF998 domain-containing protein [Skermania piniformis]
MGTALIVAGICYSSWLLEFVLDLGLDPTDSFLSELDAVGRPYRWVFALADVITGVLVILVAATALILRKRSPSPLGPPSRLTTTGWVALMIFGGATVADATLPISCIPTPDHPCPSSPSGLFPQLHHVHALTSTVAVNAIFVAMIAFTVAAFRLRRGAAYRLGRGAALRTAGLTWLLIGSIATVWLLVADNLPGDYALGVAQRIQVGMMSLWLVTLGIAVARPSPTRAADD